MTALDYYGWVLRVARRVEKADLPLADQVRRQAQSIVHNTAEELDEREQQLAEVGASLTRLCQRYDGAAQKGT